MSTLIFLFQFLLHYLKYLEDWFDPATWASLPLTRTCWGMLRDSYHSPLALRYKPQHIAIAIVYFALLCHGVEVPYNRVADTQWWKVRFYVAIELKMVWKKVKLASTGPPVHIKSAILCMKKIKSQFAINISCASPMHCLAAHSSLAFRFILRLWDQVLWITLSC